MCGDVLILEDVTATFTVNDHGGIELVSAVYEEKAVYPHIAFQLEACAKKILKKQETQKILLEEMEQMERTTTLQKFYFTFGTSEKFPYRGGWVSVYACNIAEAQMLFRKKYPDSSPGILNCSDYYNQRYFENSDMYEEGNLGAFEHDCILPTEMRV